MRRSLAYRMTWSPVTGVLVCLALSIAIVSGG